MAKGTKSSLLKTFPKKLQKLVKQIVWQENYNEEYLLVSMLSAAASAAGNSARISIKGEWTTCASLYMILVGNPGQGKTPPLDFAYAPIRKRDEDLRQQYLATIEKKTAERKIHHSQLSFLCQGQSFRTLRLRRCSWRMMPIPEASPFMLMRSWVCLIL